MHFLGDTVVLFAAALAVISISHRLRVPPLVGFLLTGMLVGPSGLGLISSSEEVEVFAELGVVFLLFVIGLEISPEKLRQLARFILVGGASQVALTLGVAAGIAMLLGAGLPQAVFVGCLVALSSTAIVLKLLSERREMDSAHGRVATGVLLFQDFLIVPLLLLVPILAGRLEGGGGPWALRFGLGLAAVTAVYLAGRVLMPRLFRLIVHTRIRELFVIGALLACLGGAWLTESLGFSPALGGFIAGLLLAETDFHSQVAAETAPFRDVFNSIFFISIGMLLQVEAVIGDLPLVLALGVGLIGAKALLAGAATAILGLPARTRLLVGLGLAQIGEFSFVLLRAGAEHGLVDERTYQWTIAVAVMTMLATPALISLAPRLADRLGARAGAGEEGEERRVDVVIVGYGLNGRHLARVLGSAGIPFLVVDLAAAAVQEARASGVPALYGDATRPDIQRAAGIERAQIAVFAISDPRALTRCVQVARQLHPGIHLIVRTGRLTDLELLRRRGADEVVAEEFESSIEVASRVLARLHLPTNVIRAQARILRQDGYQMLRAPAPVGLSPGLLRALATSVTETFLLAAGGVGDGRSIAELELRRRSGASIIAVVRGSDSHANPDPGFRLAAGDVLVLMGSHAQMEAAFAYLGGAEPAGSER